MAYWSILASPGTGGRCPAGRADRLRARRGAGAPQGSPGARVRDPPGRPGRDPHRAGGGRRAGEGERQEQLALGATPNIAARLQEVAAPDTVMSAATAQVVAGYFVPAARDPGAEGPRHTRRRLRGAHASGAQTRLDVVSPRDPTRWWVGMKRWRCCTGVGSRPPPGRAKSCCSVASPALANRAWCRCCKTR